LRAASREPLETATIAAVSLDSDANVASTARPSYTRAVVISHYRHGVEVELVDPPGRGERRRCALRSGAIDVVTGDTVHLRRAGDAFVVESRARRHSELTRHDRDGPRTVVANLDALLVVIAPEPAPHVDLIDRYLVAAALGSIAATLVCNKSEQVDSDTDALVDLYRGLEVPVMPVSARTGAGVAALAEHLCGRRAAMVGQSGVGKSSLLNALAPDAQAAVGGLSARRNRRRARGTHTTSTVRLHPLAGGGHLIDSPGVREFSLGTLDAERLTRGFPEIAAAAARCRFRDCRHGAEPGCAVRAAVQAGAIPAPRFESWRRLIADHAPPRA